MKRNRIILLVLVIAAVTFASFQGGISYLLLYLVLTLPIASFFHLLYIRARLQVHQKVGSDVLQKGEETFYQVAISSWRNVYAKIQVVFLPGVFSLTGLEKFDQKFSLLPGEKAEGQGTLRCQYRGNYLVGIQEVVLTDFLGLFRLHQNVSSHILVQVVPRVIKVDRLVVALLEEDAKSISHFTHQKELPDVETRVYLPGDSMKMVNWRLAARQQELMVRKYTDILKTKVTLLLDLNSADGDMLERIIVEDKIVESVLAVANYLLMQHVPVDVISYEKAIQKIAVTDQASFDRLYRFCSDVRFTGQLPVGTLLDEIPFSPNGGDYVFVITHGLNDVLIAAVTRIVSLGIGCCLVHVGDKLPQEQRQVLPQQVAFVSISKEQEIADQLDLNRGGTA